MSIDFFCNTCIEPGAKYTPVQTFPEWCCVVTEFPEEFEDDCLDDEADPSEEQIIVSPKSALQRIEARREQMELERMLKADFDFD